MAELRAVSDLAILADCGLASPSKTLKLYGGTDYDLANSAIIEPYFSMAKTPYGFPLDEAKWMVESLVTTDSSQASPAVGTWYNKGGSLAVPIERWRVEYAAELEVTKAAAGALDVFATLSTAASSEVNKETTTKIGISSGISMKGSVSHCGFLLDLAAKATYYLNCKTGLASMTAIAFQGKRAEDEGEGCVRLFMMEDVYYLLIFNQCTSFTSVNWLIFKRNTPQQAVRYCV